MYFVPSSSCSFIALSGSAINSSKFQRVPHTLSPALLFLSIISNIYQSIIKYKEYHKVGVQLPKINIYILTKDESRNWCKHDGIKFRNKAIPKYYNLLKDNGFDEKYFHIESCRYFTARDKNSGYEIHIRKDKYDGILHTTIERDTTCIRKEDD